MYLSDNLTVSICLYVSWRQKYKEKGKAKKLSPFLILRQVPEILVILLLRGQNHSASGHNRQHNTGGDHRSAFTRGGVGLLRGGGAIVAGSGSGVIAVAAVVSGTIRRNGQLTHSHLGIIPRCTNGENVDAVNGDGTILVIASVLDSQLGQLLAALDRRAIADNILIVQRGKADIQLGSRRKILRLLTSEIIRGRGCCRTD